MQVQDNHIQALAEKLSLEFFGRPFLHRAYVNKRLRTTGGRYLLRTHDIEVNEKSVLAFGEVELIGILKHELCHYHLHLQGKGYKHQDSDFKELLKKTGAPRYCQPLAVTKQKSSKVIEYQCSQCKIFYRRQRKINIQKYGCGICKGSLKEKKV